jgi:hypothetical protein
MITAREPIEHELKIWPSQFEAVAAGTKRHEVRKFDRDYRVGDMVRLREWAPETELYSGRIVVATISWITDPGTFGLPADVGVISLADQRRVDHHVPQRQVDRTSAKAYPAPAWPFPTRVK